MSDTPRTDAETWRDEMDHVDTEYTFAQSATVSADFARQLERELAEARKQLEDFEVEATNAINDIVRVKYQRDTLVGALSMYGLPYSDDDLEHIVQNPSPYTEIGIHEAKRELIRRKTLAAVKGGGK